jgi:hypothetical protein
MGDGDQQVDADGNEFVTASGDEVVDDGTGDPCGCCGGCACASATDCTNCPAGATATTFGLTSSGITISGACQSCATASAGFLSVQDTGGTPGNANGTAVLTQDGVDPCLWPGGIVGSGTTMLLYSNVGCVTLVGNVGGSINFEMRRISGTQFEIVGFDGADAVCFYAVATVSTCCESFTVANAAVLGGCTTLNDGRIFPTVGSGGSVTVTPCPV